MNEATDSVALSIVTWVLTGLLRWIAPSFWEKLDKRLFRMAVVALVAAGAAVATGLAQGMGALAIAKLAVSSLAGSVLLRQVTKPNAATTPKPSLGRGLSIRTKL